MTKQMRPQMHWVQAIDPVTRDVRLEMRWEIPTLVETPQRKKLVPAA